MKNNLILMLFGLLLCTACMPHIPYDVNAGMKGIVADQPKELATVVFIRPSYMGGPRPIIIYDGDTMIGVLKGYNYVVYTTEPGEKTFSALAAPMGTRLDNHASFLKADLAPGKIYYVLSRFINSFTHIYTDINPIRDNDKAWQNLPGWLAKCNLSTLNEKSYSWHEKNARRNDEVRKTYYKQWLEKDAIAREKDSIKPEDGVDVAVVPLANNN